MSSLEGLDDPAALRAGGMARYEATDYPGARRFFRKLVAMDHPAAEDAAFFYAASFFREDNWARARHEFKRLRRRFPQGRWLPAAYWHIAMCERNRGHTGRARRLFASVVRRFPGDPTTVRMAEEGLEELRGRRPRDAAHAPCDRDDLAQPGLRARADVEDGPGLRMRRGGRSHERVTHVVDVDVVARDPRLDQCRQPPGEPLHDERRHEAPRLLPRTVDRVEPKRRDAHPLAACGEATEVGGSDLRDGVVAVRLDPLALRRGPLFQPVLGGRARVHEGVEARPQARAH